MQWSSLVKVLDHLYKPASLVACICDWIINLVLQAERGQSKLRIRTCLCLSRVDNSEKEQKLNNYFHFLRLKCTCVVCSSRQTSLTNKQPNPKPCVRKSSIYIWYKLWWVGAIFENDLHTKFVLFIPKLRIWEHTAYDLVVMHNIKIPKITTPFAVCTRILKLVLL